MNTKPQAGPWDNPVLPESVYDAEIRSVTQGTYGNEDYPVVQIRFWLPEVGQHLLTNLYFPASSLVKSKQRLWHFTNMVGLQPIDIVEEPTSFESRRIRLDLRTASSRGTRYSDVHEFLPALPVDAAKEAASPASASASKTKQYTLVEYDD